MSNAPIKGKRSDLPLYLEELSVLLGRTVSGDALTSLDEVERVRHASSKLFKGKTKSFEIPFEDKKTPAFLAFVEDLYTLNPSSVFIWTERTNTCGILAIRDIKAIDFSFPFEVNSEGIIVILTSDLADQMILDFSENPNSERKLEVELLGDNWPNSTERPGGQTPAVDA